MARVSARRLGVGVGIVAAAGVVWLVVDRTAARPAVDDELATAALPAIDHELERGPWPGLLSAARPDLRPRWFCVEQVIETRRSGGTARIGVTALCEEYARDGATLLTGSGERAAKVVDLVAGPTGYRVTRVDPAPDGPVRDWWLSHGLSEAGARQAAEPSLAGETTAPQAREAFGLPRDTPVTPLPG